jgi:signal transduction histidine kinase
VAVAACCPWPDLDLLTRLSTQISLAVTLAQARADQQRLALLEERQRMARDLHDTVIQDLIAVGMQLNARIGRNPEHPWRAQDSELIDQLEDALRGLRAAVFALRTQTSAWSVSSFAESLAADSARVLGHIPEITVRGPVDELPEHIAQQVVMVLREALSNVARHARATATRVSLEADQASVHLRVDDNGQGIPAQLRPGNGIANMRHRAGALGGVATVSRRRGGGTRVEWSCPIDSSAGVVRTP